MLQAVGRFPERRKGRCRVQEAFRSAGMNAAIRTKVSALPE